MMATAISRRRSSSSVADIKELTIKLEEDKIQLAAESK